MKGFLSFDFTSEETLFTLPFSRMGLGLTMCADGDTIYFFSVQVFNFLAGNSENSIIVIHKNILKFYFIEFTIILMKEMLLLGLLFANRPKFPVDRLKLHATVKMVKNSK